LHTSAGGFRKGLGWAISPRFQKHDWLAHPELGSLSPSQGFPGEGASNDSGVVQNVDFQSFRTPLLWKK